MKQQSRLLSAKAKRVHLRSWGDTVNLASRMESHGLPDAIQVTKSVFEKMAEQYHFKERGPIEVKGKSTIET